MWKARSTASKRQLGDRAVCAGRHLAPLVGGDRLAIILDRRRDPAVAVQTAGIGDHDQRTNAAVSRAMAVAADSRVSLAWTRTKAAKPAKTWAKYMYLTPPPGYVWKPMTGTRSSTGLNRYLRLRSIPIGMKLFETVEAMEAIPKIRRPRAKHTTDQIVAQARQLGWTVGITMADLIGAQCGAVIGLHPQDEEWLSGKRMAGVWFKTLEDAAAHQHAMDVVPYGRYRRWRWRRSRPGGSTRRTSASSTGRPADDLLHQRPAVDRIQAS